MDSLFSLSRIGSPHEATFVFHPAYRPFEQALLAVSAWTHDSKTLGLEVVTKRCVRPTPTHPEMHHEKVVTVTRAPGYLAGVVQGSWKHFALRPPIAAQGL